MHAFPVSLMQPSEGLGATLVSTDDPARDTFLVRQMHSLAIAIYQAKERNDPATVSELLKRFELLADEYRQRGATDLTAMDRFIYVTGTYIGDASQAAKNLVKDAAKLVGETAGAALGPITPLLLGLGALLIFTQMPKRTR